MSITSQQPKKRAGNKPTELMSGERKEEHDVGGAWWSVSEPGPICGGAPHARTRLRVEREMERSDGG